MDHFFSQNPQLQDALKFEPFREPNSDEEEEIAHTNQGDYVYHPQNGSNQAKSAYNPYASLRKSPNIKGYKPPKIEHRNLDDQIDPKKQKVFDTNSESESQVKAKEVKFKLEGQRKEKSKLWTSLTKDIVRMGQFGCKTPTLETVNHRLNIFKSKIEKIDYMEYLQREMTQTAGSLLLSQQQQGSSNQANNQIGSSNQNNATLQQNHQYTGDQTDENNNVNSAGQKLSTDLEDDDNVGRDEEGNLIYFSFKKRLQIDIRNKVEKTKQLKALEDSARRNEIKMHSGDRRVNLTERGTQDSLKLIKEQQLMEKKQKMTLIFFVNKFKNNFDKYLKKERRANSKEEYFLKRKSISCLKTEKFLEPTQQQLFDKDHNLNFQTRVGIALYQTYQQCAGDKEFFKKTANFILKDYNKTKAAFYKKKPFPPQTTKFTNEETKSLNAYLPDFASNLYVPNKNNLFANIDTFELPPGTPEGYFIQIVDKILDGAVLRFWKESQNKNEKKAQYQANFALFDRDNDKYINLSELKELLTSVNIIFPDEELEELYNEFCLTSPEADGINEDAVFIIVSKKIMDNDNDEQLKQAFKLAEKSVNDELAKTPNETKEQKGYIRVEQFKELLMMLGNRWSEEQTIEFFKDINPKNEERINYIDVVKKLMKR